MKVRLKTAAYLDRWLPAGSETEIPDEHFDPQLHEDLTPQAAEPAAEAAAEEEEKTG